MGKFSPEFVEDLKANADIVQVIQDTVPLKKAGSGYKGLCPFHTEKTPSFNVNRDKGFFHCFGCGTGGDVVKFVELQEKLSFPEAVHQLAQRFGLQLPESDDPEQHAVKTAEREGLLNLHILAGAYFRKHLAGPAGSRARAHLSTRGVRVETIERLGLGYAPSDREGLKRKLLDAGQPLKLLLASGLVIQRDGGHVVDRFRNRLMIPICRDSGSIIAFGGRALETGQQPKYVNSPETSLYTKGKTLYGLHLSKTEIRRLGYAVMVEGYFDFAQALQAGVKNPVASCGTALTARQAKLLRRFASKVIVSFDTDPAGRSAAARSGELLMSEGLQVNVAQLDDGEDPDTAVRNHGTAYYLDKLRTSQPYLEYILDQAAEHRDFSRDGQRRAFLNDMLEVAARIPDAAARDQFADRLAHKAQVMESVVRTQLRQAAISRKTTIAPRTWDGTTTMTPAEKGLLWAMMHNTAAAQNVLASIETDDLKGLATRSILQVARTLNDWPSETVPNTLLERLNQSEAALMTQIAAEPEAPANADDCGIELRRLRFERERVELQDEIDQRQRLGTPNALEEIEGLWRRKKDILQRIEALGG